MPVIPPPRPAHRGDRRAATRRHSNDALLGELAAVSDHSEDVRDHEDADAPAEGDPNVGADQLLRVEYFARARRCPVTGRRAGNAPSRSRRRIATSRAGSRVRR